MRQSIQWCLFLLMLLTSGCIGTDYVDDMIVPDDDTVNPINGRLLLSPEEKSLLPGDTAHLSVVIVDQFNNQIVPGEVEWISSDPAVATVEEGVVTGLAVGQTEITADAGELSSSSLSLITVIADLADVARVVVSTPSDEENISLLTGETLPLSAEVFDGNGNSLADETITWRSEDESVLIVDGNGVITAVSEGATTVKASVGQVGSLGLAVDVSAEKPTVSGTFMGSNSYRAEGMVTLAENNNGEVIMTFSEDFETDFALGTYVYLSNSTSGSNTRLNGLEIAEITEGGGMTFNLSNADPDITLNSYQYVIILCKPASITFGYAAL